MHTDAMSCSSVFSPGLGPMCKVEQSGRDMDINMQISVPVHECLLDMEPTQLNQIENFESMLAYQRRCFWLTQLYFFGDEENKSLKTLNILPFILL